MQVESAHLNRINLEKRLLVKKVITDDHRANYRQMSKSNIFDDCVKEGNKQLKRTKTVDTFTPKYTTKSAFERKVSEFHKMKFGRKQELPELTRAKSEKRIVPNDNEILTPRERKFKDLNPLLDVKVINNEEKKEDDKVPVSNTDKIRQRAQTPKQKKIADNLSNVFHTNSNKHLTAFSEREEMKENNDKNKGVIAKKDFGKKSNFTKGAKSKFDWKAVNSELIHKEKNIGKTLLSARQIKLNEVEGTLSHTPKNLTSQKPIIPIEVEPAKFNELSKRNNANISSLQDKEFIKASLTAKTQDKTIDSYRSDEIDYKNFNLKEFQSNYRKNGIHIYDVVFANSRNDKGTLEFKVRNNNDDPNYQSKLMKVNDKVKKEFKLDFKVNLNKTKRPIIQDIVASCFDWKNNNSEKFFKNKNYVKSNENQHYKSLDGAEKYSSNKIEFDQSYKNNNCARMFEKKNQRVLSSSRKK